MEILVLPRRLVCGFSAPFTPCRPEWNLSAATVLRVREDMEVRAVLWTYMTADIFCNAMHIGRMDPPVYKPINRLELTRPKKGDNSLYLKLQNLGVRIPGACSAFSCWNTVMRYAYAFPAGSRKNMQSWNNGLRGYIPLTDGCICRPRACHNTTACFTKKPQFENADPDEVTVRLDGKKELALIKKSAPYPDFMAVLRILC